MKYLKKYNEELHLNPLKFGKTKVELLGGSILYIDKKFNFDKESCKIIADDCLKLIKRDLGDGWNLDRDYSGEYKDQHYFRFINDNYVIIISFSIGSSITESLQRFGYIYIYKKSCNIKSDNIFTIDNIKFSYNSQKYISGIDGFTLNSGNAWYTFKNKFIEIPNIDDNLLKSKIMEIEGEETKKVDTTQLINKDIENIKNFLPNLIGDIKDVLIDIKDYTSFSEEIIIDPNIDIKEFRKDYIKYHIPIAQIKIFWEKLDKQDKVCFKANDLDDWDYLINISKKIKQIDSHIRSIDSEYFVSSYFELIMEVDPRNQWEINIYIKFKDKGNYHLLDNKSKRTLDMGD